jgi:hypothetical protein
MMEAPELPGRCSQYHNDAACRRIARAACNEVDDGKQNGSPRHEPRTDPYPRATTTACSNSSVRPASLDLLKLKNSISFRQSAKFKV